MGWFGVHQALVHGDVRWLLSELSPRNNPNNPDDALRLAVRHLSDENLRHVLDWTEAWLRDASHDALRARGDRRWEVVSLVNSLVCAEKQRRLAEEAPATPGPV